MKICNFITLRFYFSFQKFAIKFFFIPGLSLSQIVLCFSKKLLFSVKKYIHLVRPS